MPPARAYAIEAFQNDGYAVIKALVPADRVDQLRDHLARREKAGTKLMAGDEQLSGTPNVYGDAQVDALMQDIKPMIKAHAALEVHPTYSFARIYKKGDILEPHRDRSTYEISISLNLGPESDTPWALNIVDENALSPRCRSPAMRFYIRVQS